MKVLLDACVLYPTVLREILLAVAETGLCRPYWSPRILEEWARAGARNGIEAQARGEIAMLPLRFPNASRPANPGTEAKLFLPDPNDVHVLAAAIDQGVDRLITYNLKDFPKGECHAYDILPQNPDAFLVDLWLARPEAVTAAVASVHATAEKMAGEALPLPALLKRARLPRLRKALMR